jgi:hypothetical protein
MEIRNDGKRRWFEVSLDVSRPAIGLDESDNGDISGLALDHKALAVVLTICNPWRAIVVLLVLA